MVAEEQYDLLVGKSHQPKNLVQFFRRLPWLASTWIWSGTVTLGATLIYEWISAGHELHLRTGSEPAGTASLGLDGGGG